MKTAFIVLGAQRSGTSVTSHILSELGVDFGDPCGFLQDHHNPNFFELRWVNDLNNQLVQQLGYRYTDFFLPLETDYENAAIDAIAHQIQQRVAQEWGDSPRGEVQSNRSVIGLKDPRFSLTFFVWERVLQQMGYAIQVVLVFRSPASFLQSNRKLFHNWSGWTDERHLRFWLQFNMAAVYFTRRYAVHFVSYESLMGQPVHEIERLAVKFEFDASLIDRAARVIEPSLYHHQNLVKTGDFLCDRYYQQLLDETPSISDYWLYQENLRRLSSTADRLEQRESPPSFL